MLFPMKHPDYAILSLKNATVTFHLFRQSHILYQKSTYEKVVFTMGSVGGDGIFGGSFMFIFIIIILFCFCGDGFRK